jgi:hypothetical protein
MSDDETHPRVSDDAIYKTCIQDSEGFDRNPYLAAW